MYQKIVFFDACVLYPQSVRDISMQFAVDGFYQAKWSQKAEDEFVRNVEKKKPELKGKLSKTAAQMRAAVPDSFCEASEKTIAEIKKTKTDASDVEILAAAIDAGCTYLVTFNLRDFDIGYASGRGVKVFHPDAFFAEVFNQDPMSVRESFKKAVARTKKPVRSYSDYCVGLQSNSLTKTVELLLSVENS